MIKPHIFIMSWILFQQEEGAGVFESSGDTPRADTRKQSLHRTQQSRINQKEDIEFVKNWSN